MLALLKKMFRSLGLEISFISNRAKPRYDFFKLIEHFNVDMIYDIGANVGQFGSEMREVGFGGQIISFEPLPNEHSALREKASGDQKWIVNEQCAIGDVDDYVDINISGNSVSSSILPMADIHAQAASSSAYIDKVRVPIRRLDTASMPYRTLGEKYFIKIDTQGFEWQVLDGATDILKNAIGVQVELSLVHLYEGQKLWMDVISRLEKEGFALWMMHPGFTDPADKRLLQCDGTFIRLPLPN
jgi:FkbM family methyltransferase